MDLQSCFPGTATEEKLDYEPPIMVFRTVTIEERRFITVILGYLERLQ